MSVPNFPAKSRIPIMQCFGCMFRICLVKNTLLLSCLDKNEKCLSKGRYQIAKFAMRGEDLLRALLDVSAENILDTYCPRNILQKTLFVESKNIQNAKY